jgi:hypothetical protein
LKDLPDMSQFEGVKSSGTDGSAAGRVLSAWRERTPYAKDSDFVFPSFRLNWKVRRRFGSAIELATF